MGNGCIDIWITSGKRTGALELTHNQKERKKKKKEWGDPGNEYADLGDEKNGDALRADWIFSCSQVNAPLVLEYVLG